MNLSLGDRTIIYCFDYAINWGKMESIEGCFAEILVGSILEGMYISIGGFLSIAISPWAFFRNQDSTSYLCS